MKKVLFTILTGIMMTTATMPAMAASPGTTVQYTSTCHNYVDADSDGICDNHRSNKQGTCTKNNTCPSGSQKSHRGRGQGTCNNTN